MAVVNDYDKIGNIVILKAEKNKMKQLSDLI